MNRLNRLITLPLAFALFAAAMVAVLGEPVQAPAGELRDPVVVIGSAEPLQTLPQADPLDAVDAELSATVRGEHAARLRWLITLPHARSSCCRRPI